MRKLVELGYNEFGIVVARKYRVRGKGTIFVIGDESEVWRWEIV